MSAINPAFYSLVPTFFMLLGGFLSTFFIPKPKFTSAVQHFAAGVVFAAVAVELLPELMHGSSRWTVVLGFALGVIIMLLVKMMAKENGPRIKSSMILPVGIDVFIDGVLIGIAFLVGKESGILVTVALSIEVFFLGLSLLASLTKSQVTLRLKIIINFLIALLIPLGTFIGVNLLNWLPSTWMTEIIAFGVAALLYLVTEELLVEAHEVEENPLITSLFFLGFLVILLFKI